jgi:hypothetical protein
MEYAHGRIMKLDLKVTLAGRRKSFVSEALASEKDAQESGKAYRAEDVRLYFRARAAGSKATRPKPIKW